ncbi:NTP transferase domain-containing protein [Microbacterium sp. P06]|uniref:NTP transferase domain-containing protein n=1 Tax=Microbacterium sp. P06 TaxID=3366949 RepID=UPI0037450E8E
MTLSAVILAGGRGSRMGGIVKPMLEIDGETLLMRTMDAVRDIGAVEIVVAGPRLGTTRGVKWVQEDPPFGGPVAGVAAALPLVSAAWVLVLPADLVSPDVAVRALTRATRGRDGLCLVDDDERAQWLTGLYRADTLRARLKAFPDGVRGLSARRFLEGFDIDLVSAGADAAADVDTWEHLREARRRTGARMETAMADSSARSLPPEALDAWATALRERFGLADDDLPIALILDLARDVATSVARPAAPFSAYAAGLVAGRAGGTPEQVREAVAEISRLAAEWETR